MMNLEQDVINVLYRMPDEPPIVCEIFDKCAKHMAGYSRSNLGISCSKPIQKKTLKARPHNYLVLLVKNMKRLQVLRSAILLRVDPASPSLDKLSNSVTLFPFLKTTLAVERRHFSNNIASSVVNLGPTYKPINRVNPVNQITPQCDLPRKVVETSIQSRIGRYNESHCTRGESHQCLFSDGARSGCTSVLITW